MPTPHEAPTLADPSQDAPEEPQPTGAGARGARRTGGAHTTLCIVDDGDARDSEKWAGGAAKGDLYPLQGSGGDENSGPDSAFVPDTRRLSVRVIPRVTGSECFYDLMTTLYPDTHASSEFARLLLELVRQRKVGTSAEGEPEVLLSGPTLASCMGREREYAEGNLTGDDSTGAFLAAFRDIVLPDLEWNEAVPGVRCRAVEITHLREVLHPLLLEAWEREKATPTEEVEDRVYLDTGACASATNRSRERTRIGEVMKGYANAAPTPLSRRVYELMASIPSRSFSRVQKRVEKARTVVEGLEKVEARAGAHRTLDRIAEEPVQRYHFTDYSVRLWGDNPGVATVATDVRRTLLSDCYEVDLKSSQLAIAAREWGCERLHGFLDAGASFWEAIVEHIGLLFDAASKEAVKRGTYGLVYGAGEDRISGDIREEYKKESGSTIGVEQAARFLTHPLVREVMEARDAELERIREQGFVQDCFGRVLDRGQVERGGMKYPARGAEAARSLLAQKAQARELWLLEPIIALTERESTQSQPEWRILCWQHDGCSIRFRRRAKQHLQRLQDAVAERARRYGYPTRLEVKYDPQEA